MISNSTAKVVNSHGEVVLAALPGPLYDLYSKGCAVPDPIHVTFNKGEKVVYKKDKDGNIVKDKNDKPVIDHTYPILTTVVNWATGEKTVVQNSEGDGLVLNADGSVSTFSKECGFVFALAKRVLAGKISRNDDGELEYSEVGFGSILNNIVKNATDQQELVAKRKADKKLSEQRRLESEKRHVEKANAPEPSLRNCVKELAEAIEMLKTNITNVAATKKPVAKKAINKKVSKKTSTVK